MSAVSPLMETKALEAWYSQKPVISNINFVLAPGQLLALIGANGSGKTTLLRCLTGIIKNLSGSINIRGENIRSLSRRKLARIAASVPQNALRPAGLSVYDMVLLGRYPWLNWFGLYDNKDRALAIASMRDAGITGLAHRDVSTLSGGEWQRSLLARALCQIGGQKEPLLLLDEIAAGLDFARSLEIFHLLACLKDNGAGIIVSVHDCNLAAMFATHILALKNGMPLFCGPVANVFTKENLSALYDIPIGLYIHPDLGIPQVYPRFDSSGPASCHFPSSSVMGADQAT